MNTELAQKLEPGGSVSVGSSALPSGAATETTLSEVRDAVESLDVSSGRADIFGHTVTSRRENQIEVPLDDANWQDFVTVTTSGGASTPTQADGQVTISSGTNTNGTAKVVSKDSVKYRANSEIGWGFTCRFPVAGVAGSYAMIGPGDTSRTNGVFIGYVGTTFGIHYYRGGALIFSKTTSQWLDQCNGGAESAYKSGGSPVAMNPAFDQLFRIRAGLFGHAGWLVEIRTPDQTWLTIYKYTLLNAGTVPVFTNFDLPITAFAEKSAAGATNVQVVSACWAGWTGSDKNRISSTITTRSLASDVRAILVGETVSGGFAFVKVNSQGRLQVTNDSVGATGAAVPTSASLAGVRDGSGNLQALVQPTTPVDTQPVLASSQSVIKRSISVAVSGDSTIYTPTSGKKIRLYFFGYSAGIGVTGVLVGLKLDGYNGGNVIDQQYLTSPGQPYARNIQAGAKYVEGSTDGVLKVNLGGAQSVYINFELEEVT